MKRAVHAGVVVLGLCAVCGCGFASRHPAITAGIVGGVVGGGTCEFDGANQLACGIITGSAALFLGGIAALVTLLADTTDHSLPPDDPDNDSEPGTVRVRTHTEPPPMPLDAGMSPGDAMMVDVAP